MRQGTYRLTSGALLRCRTDRTGRTRCEVELADGRRRDVDPPATEAIRLLSDDPGWLEDPLVALGGDV